MRWWVEDKTREADRIRQAAAAWSAIDSRRARAAGGTANIDNHGQTVVNYSETETVLDHMRAINMVDAAVDERGG